MRQGKLSPTTKQWKKVVRQRINRAEKAHKGQWDQVAFCIVCGVLFPAKRKDALLCSPRCRQRKSREERQGSDAKNSRKGSTQKD